MEINNVVIITGSRDFDREDLMRQELEALPSGTIVMHGGARGADWLAMKLIQGDRYDAKNPKPNNGISGLVEVRVPYISTLGKKGGHERNRVMLEMALAMRDSGYDLWVLAFHADGANLSPGTRHMVGIANDADLSVIHIDAKRH